MKNKLLKISVLVLLILSGFYFLSDSSSEVKTRKDVNSIEKNVEKKTSVFINNLSLDKKSSNVNNIKEVNVSNSNSFKKKREAKISNDQENELDSVETLRRKYSEYLVNHPFRKGMQIPRAERKAAGIPPNAFFEQEWLYTTNPVLGRSTPEVKLQLQMQLEEEERTNRVPGDGLDNKWIERGPNNVGGRTRALMFAPGSTTRVFAGGVSGGLWVNNDITSSGSQWQQVDGVPGNLAVTCITVDPNNSNIMYLGTGEVHTGGDVNGNGVYKSINGGTSWINIFGAATNANVRDNITYIQDIIAWNNPTTNQTEVFFGSDAFVYSQQVIQGPGWAWLGLNTIGMYRSTDGVNFARLTNSVLRDASNNYYAPNSFDIGADGKLWMGTKRSSPYGAAGGMVFSTTNGTTWTKNYDFLTNGRVELVTSKQNANKLYALLQNRSGDGNQLARFAVTTDGFSSASFINIPDDVDTGIPANDFTRGQSFYDLLIGIDPNNDNTLIIGGIDLFKTTNGGTTFTQISKWSNNNNLAALNVPVVHADQHCIAYANSSALVLGNDGGVYYSGTGGSGSSIALAARNNGYNVTQFVRGGINQTGATQKLVAGAQDNGTQFINNAPQTPASSTAIAGGDGFYCFVDKQDAYMISSYVYNVYRLHSMTGTNLGTFANDQSTGDFVNQCDLDSNSDILYANGTTGTPTYQIKRYSGANFSTTDLLTDPLLNSYPIAFRASPYTSNRLMVGLANGRLLRLNNANTTPIWTSVGDASWVGAISEVRYGASENDIFVTFHNYGVASVWYTSNGGTTWQNKEGDLPNIPVKCILQNPNATNEVIIGTELGVWYTINFNASSPNWRRANNGMKDVKVMSFDYRSVDNTILAATYARGMWSGQFWQCGDLSTTWNGSTWSNGVPTSKTAVTFAGNYSSTSSLDACSVTVNTGANVVFNSGHSLRVGENVTVNGTGTLTFENNAALVQYTKHAVNTGNITIKRNSANMIRLDYTAWGSPVSGQNLLAFSPNTISTRFYQYLFTGTTTPTAYQSVNPTTNSFQTAKGYMIRVSNNWTSIAPGAPYLGQFTGVPNNGSITYAVGQGYNLISNPYPSPISAKSFLINNPKVDALYYWTHTVPAVGSSYPSNNYASYTLLGGTASANGSAVPNDYIQVGQGFFVNATTAYTVNFENEYRADATLSTQFFRQQAPVELAQEVEKHRVWLNLNSENQNQNQILIGYMANATSNVDNKIDALVLNSSNSMIYSIIDEKAYVIQGRGLPFDENDVVPLGFKATQNSPYEIEINNFDGLFENQDIYLRDKFIGAIHNLKSGKYYFLSDVGDFKNRFELLFKRPSISQDITAENQLMIFTNEGKIKLNSSDKKIQSVEVFDVLGKQIVSQNNIENNDYIVSNLSSSGQTFIVRVVLEDGNQITKKIIF